MSRETRIELPNRGRRKDLLEIPERVRVEMMTHFFDRLDQTVGQVPVEHSVEAVTFEAGGTLKRTLKLRNVLLNDVQVRKGDSILTFKQSKQIETTMAAVSFSLAASPC